MYRHIKDGLSMSRLSKVRGYRQTDRHMRMKQIPRRIRGWQKYATPNRNKNVITRRSLNTANVGTADAWSAFNQRPPTDRYVGARRGLVLSMRATFNAANGTSTIIKSSLGLKSRAFCHFRSVYQNFVTVFAHDTYSKTGTSRRRLLLSMCYTAKEACPRAPRKQFDNVNASAH